MTYDKKSDPYRVDEKTVRSEVERRLADHEEFTLVKQGDFTEGGDGYYGTVQCVLQRPTDQVPWESRPFSLHEIVVKSEADGVRGIAIINGTYDLTLDEAVDLL